MKHNNKDVAYFKKECLLFLFVFNLCSVMKSIAVGDLIDKVRPQQTELIAIALEHHHRLTAALDSEHLLAVAIATVQHFANCNREFFAFQAVRKTPNHH